MPGRILIAEDDPLLGEALVDVLARAGYEVVLTPDGQAALHVLEEWEPDLVLLDLNMPVLDGKATLQQIRSRPGHDHRAVLMMSARVQALPPAEGATRHEGRLQKPFAPEQLLAAVSSALPR